MAHVRVVAVDVGKSSLVAGSLAAPVAAAVARSVSGGGTDVDVLERAAESTKGMGWFTKGTVASHLQDAPMAKERAADMAILRRCFVPGGFDYLSSRRDFALCRNREDLAAEVWLELLGHTAKMFAYASRVYVRQARLKVMLNARLTSDLLYGLVVQLPEAMQMAEAAGEPLKNSLPTPMSGLKRRAHSGRKVTVDSAVRKAAAARDAGGAPERAGVSDFSGEGEAKKIKATSSSDATQLGGAPSAASPPAPPSVPPSASLSAPPPSVLLSAPAVVAAPPWGELSDSSPGAAPGVLQDVADSKQATARATAAGEEPLSPEVAARVRKKARQDERNAEKRAETAERKAAAEAKLTPRERKNLEDKRARDKAQYEEKKRKMAAPPAPVFVIAVDAISGKGQRNTSSFPYVTQLKRLREHVRAHEVLRRNIVVTDVWGHRTSKQASPLQTLATGERVDKRAPSLADLARGRRAWAGPSPDKFKTLYDPVADRIVQRDEAATAAICIVATARLMAVARPTIFGTQAAHAAQVHLQGAPLAPTYGTAAGVADLI